MTGGRDGAIDGARTRDIQDHNLALYQLSYDRRTGRFWGSTGRGSTVRGVDGCGKRTTLAFPPKRRQIGAMPTTLSIKNAPDAIVSRLRERASRNHRSLQGELLAIIEEATQEPLTGEDLHAIWRRARAADLTRDGLNSTELVRAMRDARYGD